MIMFLAGGLCLCAQERTITWTTDPVDGHRTGVVASNASNVEEAMGTVKDVPTMRRTAGSSARGL